MQKRHLSIILLVLVSSLILAACQPQTVEVTRVVTETEVVTETVTEQIEVTRMVEGESVTELQEVEVTRVVETIVDPTECNLEPPAEETELNMIGWSFPITDYYAEELEKCSKVENLTINASLLASADAQEQVRLALSSGGDSP